MLTPIDSSKQCRSWHKNKVWFHRDDEEIYDPCSEFSSMRRGNRKPKNWRQTQKPKYYRELQSFRTALCFGFQVTWRLTGYLEYTRGHWLQTIDDVTFNLPAARLSNMPYARGILALLMEFFQLRGIFVSHQSPGKSMKEFSFIHHPGAYG